MRLFMTAAALSALALPLCQQLEAQQLPRAEPAALGISEDTLKTVKTKIEGLIAERAIPGAVIMIARDGKVASLEAYGSSDMASGAPMQTDSIFRIYSMTKPITSVAALMLLERGKLALDDPAEKYLPWLAGRVVERGGERIPARRPMTIKDLMTHTAGLSYGLLPSDPIEQAYQRARLLESGSLEEFKERFAPLPLFDHPGEGWRYSIATDLLGRIVEVASGQRLDHFFAEHIFTPLGMVDTGFHCPKAKQHRLAAMTIANLQGTVSPAPNPASDYFLTPPALHSGGGGLVSTAEDYMRFALMLAGGGRLGEVKLLEAETVALMTRNHLDEQLVPIVVGGFPMPNTGFGLGVSVKLRTGLGERQEAIGEYGWSGAASTSWFNAPRAGLTVIALTQVMPFSLRMLMALSPLTYKLLAAPKATPSGKPEAAPKPASEADRPPKPAGKAKKKRVF